MYHSPHKQGFSLIELSIVLVILGLLVGGVLSGQQLIRAAEIRSVTTDLHRYNLAVLTFKERYGHLPGDFPLAFRLWGDELDCTDDFSNDVASGCNGDGNGIINRDQNATPPRGEFYRLWQHLSSAGLIEGRYSGLSHVNTRHTPARPPARIGRGFWGIHYYRANIHGWFNQGRSEEGTQLLLYQAGLSSEEAWSLDNKIDNGKPGTGALFIHGTGVDSCFTAPVVAGRADALEAEYMPDTVPTNSCWLIFVITG